MSMKEAAKAAAQKATVATVAEEEPSKALAVRQDSGGGLVSVDEHVSEALALLDGEGMGGDLGLMNINGAADALGSALPQIKICQLMGSQPEHVQFGQFYHAITGEAFDTITVTLMVMKFSRQWLVPFDEGDGGLEVICSASQGDRRDNEESKRPEIAPPLGTLCAKCPKCKWGADRKAPVCSELYALLLYVHDSQEPGVFFVRRTAIAPWRKAAQQIKLFGMRGQAKFGRVPANLLVRLEIFTEKMTEGARRWAEPRFRNVRVVDDLDTVKALVQATAQLAPMFVKARAEELEQSPEAEPWDEDPAARANTVDASVSTDDEFKL